MSTLMYTLGSATAQTNNDIANSAGKYIVLVLVFLLATSYKFLPGRSYNCFHPRVIYICGMSHLHFFYTHCIGEITIKTP